jgi:NAD(P) transhydrogenase subunit alpha
VEHGVTILGPLNLPASMPKDASTLFSRNLAAFVLAFWREKERRLDLDLQDAILKSCVVTRDGELLHAQSRELVCAGVGR